MRIFGDLAYFDKKACRPNTAASTLPSAVDQLRNEGPVSCDPEIQALHEHLSSSLQTFQPKVWRPLTPDLVHRSTFLCHRPASGRHSSQTARPATAMSDHVSRRRIVSARYPAPRPDTLRVQQGDFDTLSPCITSKLITDTRPSTPLATYGNLRLKPARERILPDKRSSDLELSDNDAHVFSDDDDFGDNDSLSELERGSEPLVDRNRRVPDIRLRPENPDDVYVPPRKSDMRRFDFDAENNLTPEYPFPCPLPQELTKINLRLCSLHKFDWRCSSHAASVQDPDMHGFIDRLVEIEGHQARTVKWEEKRFKRQRKRSVHAKVSRPRDRRCCQTCLQPACVGDCPAKRTAMSEICDRCRQPFCTGTCTETKYDQRMRLPREDIEATLPSSTIGKSCKTCQGQNNAKSINSTLEEVGRPNSAMITFSRGQGSSVVKPKRPSSADCFNGGLNKPKLEPKRVFRRQKRSHRGRNGLIPGKSLVSNLTISLTELSLVHY